MEHGGHASCSITFTMIISTLNRIGDALFRAANAVENKYLYGTPSVVFTQETRHGKHKDITIFLEGENTPEKRCAFSSGNPDEVDGLAKVVNSCITRKKEISLVGQYDHGRFVFYQAEIDGNVVNLR